jgi:mycothiol synthase
MEKYSRRPYLHEDMEKVIDLLLEYRLATSVRTYPTTWRLRVLLSSRVWDIENDSAIWQDQSGLVIGFAMLWSRYRGAKSLTMEYFLRPMSCTGKLATEVISWGKKRTIEIAKEGKHEVRLYTMDHLLEDCQQAEFSKLGFMLQEVDPERHAVFFIHHLDGNIPRLNLPLGYEIKFVRTEGDLKQYEIVYGFSEVNSDFRKSMLASDEYNHLVVSNPKCNFVSYCEYSFSRSEWKRGAERIGWIDYVGTKEGEQGRGFGTALLFEALSNLQSLGVKDVMLVTISDNRPAIRIFEKTGFIPANGKTAGQYWIVDA